ncbi:HTH_Tnp_Tc3_2 domain-containing protein [Trichonephila clavipes]|nr:HTH_Tnp_Tc3_2 domain-containing protein [Trichonephila clavipes]
MQSTGNHQMARIVRHNDVSVREVYIRTGGKEVKLFTSALKPFQCNNRIVMAQLYFGSPVVKVSDYGMHITSSCPVPLKTRLVGQRCTLNLSRAETSSHGVVL